MTTTTTTIIYNLPRYLKNLPQSFSNRPTIIAPATSKSSSQFQDGLNKHHNPPSNFAYETSSKARFHVPKLLPEPSTNSIVQPRVDREGLPRRGVHSLKTDHVDHIIQLIVDYAAVCLGSRYARDDDDTANK